MKFNDTTNKTGLIQHCEMILGMADTDISGDATLLKQFTGLINAHYRRVNSLIWSVTGTWEYDDSNLTDLPISTTTIVDDQQDYEMPSTAQKIDRVEVMNSDGDYQLIKPLDKSQITTDAMSEFNETAGMPVYYDLLGRSIFLYPKPSTSDVTAAAGLKLYFTRDVDQFVSTDTTTEPGFVNNFHPILSFGASLDYCISRLPDEVNKINNIRAEINALKDELKGFYGNRHRDLKTRIRVPIQNYK